MSLKMSVHATPGHSSLPPAPGTSAIAMMSHALARLDDNQMPAEIQGVARAMFEGTLCAFSSSAAAVRAAIAISFPGPAEASLPARVAVHAGRCIAVSRGARVEYFGETIERTTALLADARAGVTAVSSAVDDEPSALAAMLAPGLARTVGTTRAGEYGGRRVTWLARAD